MGCACIACLLELVWLSVALLFVAYSGGLHGAAVPLRGGAGRAHRACCRGGSVGRTGAGPAARRQLLAGGIAGAGQRRTSRGLLHQGSVAGVSPAESSLAAALSDSVVIREFEPDPAWLADKVSARYASEAWARRC